MYAMVRASVRACSKLALGWSRTAARQTSPSRFSLSLLIRRSSMFAPGQHGSRGKDRRPDNLSGPVERLADPHRNDGLTLGFIQVGPRSIQLLGQSRPQLGRRQHQGLDRVGGLLRGAMGEPTPGAILALALAQPAKSLGAGVGCRRGEREDGVGGGIEGGTMPLVDPVIAVYARITQVLDDFLLNHVLAGERRSDLEHLEDVGVRRHRRVTLEREGKEEIHALEWPQ